MDGDILLSVWYTANVGSFVQLLGENFVVLQQLLAGGGPEPASGTGEMGTTGKSLEEGGSG